MTKPLYLRTCLISGLFFMFFRPYAQEINVSDSLWELQRPLKSIIDSARNGSFDSSEQALHQLIISTEHFLSGYNQLIKSKLIFKGIQSDTVQSRLDLLNTEIENQKSRIEAMNDLVLFAWATAAAALFLFFVFLLLYIKKRKIHGRAQHQYVENERLLGEYRRRNQELQHALEQEKSKIPEDDPEKNYLREKLKRYQEDIDKMSAERKSLEDEMARMLDRLREM